MGDDMRLTLMYFSPTHATKKIVSAVGKVFFERMLCETRIADITPLAARMRGYAFGEDDVLIFGAPVYGGRVPPLLVPFLRGLSGNGARAVALSVYGNRDYDDALAETRDLLRLPDMDEKQLPVALTEQLQLLHTVAERQVVKFGTDLLQLGKKAPGSRGLDTIPSCGPRHVKDGGDRRDVLHPPEAGRHIANGVFPDPTAAVDDENMLVHLQSPKNMLSLLYFNTTYGVLQAFAKTI